MNKEKKDSDFNSLIYPIGLVTQIGVTVSVTVGVLIVGGKYLDDSLGTAPLFILLGGVIAFVASMYEVYLLVLPVIKKGEDSDRKAK